MRFHVVGESRWRVPAVVTAAICALAVAPAPMVSAVEGEETEAVQVLEPTFIERSLGELPVAPEWEPGDPIKEIPRRATRRGERVPPPEPMLDPLLAAQEAADAEREAAALAGAEPDAFGTPILNFAGGGFTGVNPPDTVGEVGLSHYVQLINASGGAQIRVYNKSGTLVAGPAQLDSLAPPGACANGLGDGVALYHQYADRWILTEFSGTGNNLCLYVSTTGNPATASWYVYQLPTTDFPDYPKYGIMPDALYIGTNENVPRAYALNLPPMLSGQTTSFFVRTATWLSGFVFQMLQPVDADGIVPPPPGSPGMFLRHVDTEAHGAPGGADRLEMFQFTPNFTAGTSTWTGPININVAEFDSSLCGLVSFNCIPQPGTGVTLDPLREVVMHRAQYRNFGRHQSIVGTFVTDVTGTDRAAVRWFELRNTGTGWSLYQEGTYAPTTTHRWMSSIAMDGAGDIALAYSVSSSAISPGIHYTGRTAGGTLGTMTEAEALLVAGSASNSSNRWGDYSSLNVDPADECTFWFTTEYNTSSSWSTRIGTMKFDSCVPFVKGDINQNLATDLIFRNNVSGQNDFWLMNGTTRSSLVTLSPTPSSLDWQIAGTDDFNGDNKNDLALWNSTAGLVEFWLMNGTTRTGVAPLTGASTLAPPWKLSATADFNRDGKPDLVWRNFSTQKIVIWTMNGTAKVGEIIPFPDQAVDANWEIVGAFDLNNDGYIDFLWYNPNSGKIVAWVMDASVVRIFGNFTNPSNAGDNNWKVLAGGDYGIGPTQAGTPQPGSRDIVWRNATSGNIVVWHMDYNLNRTAGVFANPTAPSPNPTDWTIVGPR